MDQNVVAHFDPAAPDRPLKTVGHDRSDQSRGFRRKRIADFGREHVGRKIDVVGKAAEQMGRLIALGAPTIVGALAAKALIVAPAVGAATAAKGAFQYDAVAFFDFVNLRGVATKLLDAGENFMAENNRIGNLQLTVQVFYVRAADAAHLDFQQSAIRRNVGHRVFADFQFVRT